MPNRDDGLIAVGIDVEAIIAGLLNCERLVGRIDFVCLAVVEAAHVQVHRALVQAQLHDVLVDVGRGETGFGIDANDACSYAEFGTRIFVGPNVVAVRKRTVQLAADPITGSLWLQRNRAAYILKTCRSCGNIRLVRLRIRLVSRRLIVLGIRLCRLRRIIRLIVL